MNSGPLHERVSRALDDAGDATGPELLNLIEQRYRADPELIAEVRALLGDAEGPVPVLDAPQDQSITPTQVRSAVGMLRNDHRPRPIPAEVAGYRIVRVVGEGGMGVVYEGEQREPRRRVAVKVLRPLLSISAVQRRIRLEAQVLARLTHPGIAHIIESGVDPRTNEAFFAMEFVEGAGLREHAGPLPIADRCELVARVCDAVQHAHQKGVIHRDIKPSNILVEPEQGGPGRPRVLDFGVAKLLEEGEHATLSMSEGTLVGTLGYMSPEALAGAPDAIDTRTDVYSLGVLLYELLAARPPVDIRGLPITEVARRVRDEQPARLDAVNARIPKDLATVAHKALEKDPARRYDSAGALGADLRRFLRGEPVTAQPPSAAYIIRKFVGRHRAASAAAGAAVVALLAGLTVSLALYARAENSRRQEQAQRERASAILDYLVKDMLGAASPERVGKDARIIDQLDELGKNVGTRFPGQPELEAEVRMQLSMVMNLLGMQDQAMEQARAARPLLEHAYGPDDRHTIDALVQEATILADQGEGARAMPLVEDAIARATRTLEPSDPTRLSVEGLRGNCLHAMNRPDEAVTVLRDVVARAEHAPGVNAGSLFAIRGNYLTALIQAGKMDEAAGQYATCLRESESVNGVDHPATISIRNNFAACLMKLGRKSEALEVIRPLVDLVQKRYPADHPFRAMALQSTATILIANGRGAESVPYAVNAADAFVRAYSEDHWQTERAYSTVVRAQVAAGDATAARAWAQRLIAARLRLANTDEGVTVKKVWSDTAAKLAPVDKSATPAALLEDTLASMDVACPVDHPRRAQFLINLARACNALGRTQDAQRLLGIARPLPDAAQGEVKALLDAAVSETTPGG
ncbi:MAG: protein kinase [Phycisphaerales bacterium]